MREGVYKRGIYVGEGSDIEGKVPTIAADATAPLNFGIALNNPPLLMTVWEAFAILTARVVGSLAVWTVNRAIDAVGGMTVVKVTLVPPGVPVARRLLLLLLLLRHVRVVPEP